MVQTEGIPRYPYDDLLAYHKAISELPAESHYHLLTTWDFHTYMLEPCQYSPEICLFAVPERGKSRTGMGLRPSSGMRKNLCEFYPLTVWEKHQKHRKRQKHQKKPPLMHLTFLTILTFLTFVQVHVGGKNCIVF